MSLLQFKDYVATQRVTRWRLKNEIELQARKCNALMNEDSKDGNARNISHFGNGLLTTFKPGDISKAESCQEQIVNEIKDVEEQIALVLKKRSNLFDSNNQVKHWRANELEFLDEQKTALDGVYSKLQSTHSTIISNVNILKRKLDMQQDRNVESKRKRFSKRKNAARSIKEKNKRLMLKVEETVKLMTNGRLTYTEISKNDDKKITLTDICTECILKPRFHANSLDHLLKNNFFHADAMEFAESKLEELNSTREKETKRKSKYKHCAEIKSKQSSLFLEHFKPSNSASIHAESSSSDSDDMSGSLDVLL